MFERYTEEARQSIFFARYEAGTMGQPEIETEHLLLGILRADRNLARRMLPAPLTSEAVRARIERENPPKAKAATSVDLPVSHTAKRALAYAAEEAERMGHPHIRLEHLLLGIAREPSCLGAEILRQAGATVPQLRQAMASSNAPVSITTETQVCDAQTVPSELLRDLTRAAENGDLNSLIGREIDLGRLVQILSRRTKNNAALIGEAGVGKTAIVEGFAQLLAEGATPGFADHRVLTAEAISLFPGKRVDEILNALADQGNAVVCFEGLFDLDTSASNEALTEAMHRLEPHLACGGLRCIATGTPAGFRRTSEKAGMLARHFEVVGIAAPDPAEAVTILNGLKGGYERFHGVMFGEGTMEMVVYASGRFLAHRALPDRALDLLDEAGARVRLRPETEPDRTVTPEDVEQVVADRAGVSVAAVKAILAQKGPGNLEQTMKEMAARISVDGNGWVALLAAYVVRSSDEDIDALVNAIRAARAG